MQPFERQIDPYLFDQTVGWEQTFILTVDPCIADVASEDHFRERIELIIIQSGPHILKVIEAMIRRDEMRVEGLE